jgi:hypothetical protein
MAADRWHGKPPAEPGNEHLTALTALPGSFPALDSADDRGIRQLLPADQVTSGDDNRRLSMTIACGIRVSN